MSITSSYGAGKRAGRSQPRSVVVDGHHYLETPICPFKWWQPIRAFLWHEGCYNGTMERLQTWLSTYQK